MPQLRGVTVHVVDRDGNDLQEWGVRTLGSNRTAVSAFIQSANDMPFRVSVRPKIPYDAEQQQSEGDRRKQGPKNPDEIYIKEEEGAENEGMGQISIHPHSKPQYRKVNPHTSRRWRSSGDQNRFFNRQRDSDGHPASSAQFRRRRSYDTAPPFHLLASLYLDGRAVAERRSVIYLDPSEEDFSHPDGKVTFNHRRVQGRNGGLKEQAWIFKDVGIETVFRRVALSDHDEHLQDPDDLLVDAMRSSKLVDRSLDAIQEQGKVGQILVVLQRVRLGRKYVEDDYHAKLREGDEGDTEMDEMGPDVAHRTAFKDLRTVEPEAKRCVEYVEYKKNEPAWATFQFFYRSQEQLEKFGFPGFPQSFRAQRRSHLRGGRRWDTNLEMLTPLSIAKASKKAPTSTKRPKDTFEERVRRGKSDFEPVKYDFHGYRGSPDDDVRATGYGQVGNDCKVGATSRRANGVDKKHDNQFRAQGILSTVVAVKERGRRPSQTLLFMTGPSRSGSASPGHDQDSPADPSQTSLVEAPANSPTTGFYNPVADPRLAAPKGSALDTFRTLSDASLKLTDTGLSAHKGQLTPQHNVKDAAYRQIDYSSDADDEKGNLEDTGLPEMDDDDDDGGPSDKENMPSRDGDDSGLHKRLNAVSLGAKRQRGEGTDEADEADEAEARQPKKLVSPTTDEAPSIPGAEQGLQLLIEEGKQGIAAVKEERQQAKKRFKA
ncbi:MAG: hypothetical protein Q9207_005409 [Kuettlingeria erythrocarpa]